MNLLLLVSDWFVWVYEILKNNFEKSISKIWINGINDAIFAPAIRNRGVEPMDELIGDEMLDSRVLGCGEFFRMLPGRRSEKKLQKFLLKNLERMKKSLPLQPLSEWSGCSETF